MGCEGLHCPGCKEASGLALTALIIAAAVCGAGAVVAWVLANLEVIAAGFVAADAVILTLVGRAIRRELRGPTWHGEARTSARVNGPTVASVPAMPAPARPMLTAAQVGGLAQLGQAVYDVQAYDAHAASRAHLNGTVIHDAKEIR